MDDLPKCPRLFKILENDGSGLFLVCCINSGEERMLAITDDPHIAIDIDRSKYKRINFRIPKQPVKFYTMIESLNECITKNLSWDEMMIERRRSHYDFVSGFELMEGEELCE